jgi:DNA-binding NarL/FixJ family response regulator
MIIYVADLFPFKRMTVKTRGLLEVVNDHILPSIRVLLVDDDPAFLTAVNDFLKPELQIEVVGHAHSGRDAVQRVEELQPDLVLMDLVMPGINGLAATRLIKTKFITTRVIILTQHDEPLYRFQAEAANADGFVAKSEIHRGLLPLIHSLGIDR